MKRENAEAHARLEAESAIFTVFLELLREEQDALVRGETDQLPQLSARKAELIGKLNVFSAERNRALAAASCSADARGMAKWLDAIDADANTRASWNHLLELVKEAEQVNKNNGALIDTHLHHNQQTLAVLRAAANPSSVYGPSGHLSGPIGGMSRDKA